MFSRRRFSGQKKFIHADNRRGRCKACVWIHEKQHKRKSVGTPRKLWEPKGWKTGHGIREALLVRGLLPRTKEWKQEYFKEYAKINRDKYAEKQLDQTMSTIGIRAAERFLKENTDVNLGTGFDGKFWNVRVWRITKSLGVHRIGDATKENLDEALFSAIENAKRGDTNEELGTRTNSSRLSPDNSLRSDESAQESN